MNSEAWEALYGLLALFGASKRPIPIQAGEGALSLAWPDEKVALALPGDRDAPFRAAGWTLHRMSSAAAFGGHVDAISACGSDVRAAVAGVATSPAVERSGGMSAEAWSALYDLLARFGASKSPTHLRHGSGALSCAWPDQEIALVLPNDRDAPFKAAGWTLHRLASTASFGAHVEAISECAFDVMISASASDAENPSQPEQLLLAAMMRAGLPMPDRGLKVMDPITGDLRSIPDYVWADRGFVLDLDGWFHHHGRYLTQIINAAAASRSRKGKFMRKVKDQASKDAAKRRLLSRLGYTVNVVTDGEIEEVGAEALALEIRAQYDLLAPSFAPRA